MQEAEYIDMIHAERARIVSMLEGMSEHDWTMGTLCFDWNVEQVVAHLSAAANTGKAAWMLSMLRAGFNPAKHNQRRLLRYLGATPANTLETFRNSVKNNIFPTRDYGAWLGEVIVHGQDIARPLEINLVPDPKALQCVAELYSSKDFAVNSAKLTQGLRLEATDADFQSGSGPLVKGNLKDLVMAMAGRTVFLVELDGDGVAELSRRVE